jgi:hypothetical protein
MLASLCSEYFVLISFPRLSNIFSSLFEYEEYISLKGIHDPNEGHVLFLLLIIQGRTLISVV